MIYQEYSLNFSEMIIFLLIFISYCIFFYLIIKAIWISYFKRKNWEYSEFKNLAIGIGVLIYITVVFSFYWANIVVNLMIASAILIISILWFLRIKQKIEYREILPLLLITEGIMLVYGIAFYYSIFYYLNLANNVQILPI